MMRRTKRRGREEKCGCSNQRKLLCINFGQPVATARSSEERRLQADTERALAVRFGPGSGRRR